MKIKDHIAYRFLTDLSMTQEIVEHTYPKFNMKNIDSNPIEMIASVNELYKLVEPENQKAYYITNTVMDKLDMLKVSRKADGNFDWSVFDKVSNRKVTFILPNGSLLRIKFCDDTLQFCHLYITEKWNDRYGEIKWVLFFSVKSDNHRLSENFNSKDVKQVDELVYKILCFMYLSDNTEQVVPAGQRYGTKKNGKLVNESPFPVTVVTSNWNVTSIRTEGFSVSGHFRLQPYKDGIKMIFIQPFEKKGYTRRAKNS